MEGHACDQLRPSRRSEVGLLSIAECVIPNLGVRQPREGSCEHHIGAVPLHARSLVPLVRARDFGMTPLLENFGDRH
jgi:hypothetical protein